ncbi:MAG: type II toxin-antitoxin system Phd/YefM family antitoxin [Sulfuricellaceae bacterium]|nr:type II toxin-antitoxin system Phd/YefM family antitoxin [Sulfuricellaceae bacterium]
MDKQYSIADARHHLASIVHEVEQGQPARLTRRGKAVAVLISEADYQQLLGHEKADLWTSIEDFRRTHRLDKMPFSDEDFAGLRDQDSGREFEWES